MSKITVVILNYKRPDNIIKYIIPNLLNNNLIKNIIISHALPETFFKDYSNYPQIIHLKHFEENKKFGVFCRFLATGLANTNCIAFHDDDFLICNNSIVKCFNSWQNNKKSIHGFRGRNIKKDEYIKSDASQENVPIVLTQFALTAKSCINFVLNNYLKLDSFVRDCNPIWNGEDIFLSLTAILNSKKLNKIYHFDYHNLPQYYAIHENPNHYEHRTYVVKKILNIYPELLDLFKNNNYDV